MARRGTVGDWSIRKLATYIEERASSQGLSWVLEDDDGTEVTIGSNSEVKIISGGGLNINWTDVSSGTDSDPYDLTLTIDPTDATAVDIAAGDLVLIADASDSNNLKRAAVGYAWDGSDFYIDGKLGIGVSDPTYALDIPNSSDATGIARATAFVTYSSRRLKSNISKIEEPLDIVKNLRGVTFNWKDTNKREIGLIAEEVNEILPEIVAYHQGKPAALDYPKLVALLIECVKELQEKVDLLEKSSNVSD